MEEHSFVHFRELLYRESGLAISEEKIYLLKSRLKPIARRLGLDTMEELAAFMLRTHDAALIREVVNAMTTNETLFFRDSRPFELLSRECVPRIVSACPAMGAVGGPIRIWSAACSTGQEPYSIAMALLENADALQGRDFEIIASDICDEALHKADTGIYSAFELQRGLLPELRDKYFRPIDENRWQIARRVRDKVTFRNFNLLDDMAGMGCLDIVFCRNVLIYFDQETKAATLEKIARRVNPGGYLFLGASETILGISDSFRVADNIHGLYTVASDIPGVGCCARAVELAIHE